MITSFINNIHTPIFSSFQSMLANKTVFIFILPILLFAITLFFLPIIRMIVLKLSLTTKPNSRSSHTEIVPSFGGVAFYIGLLLTLSLTHDDVGMDLTIILMTSLTIIFMVGVKDDLNNISPLKKLFGQIVAISLLLFHPEFHVHSFYGFLGIHEVSLFFSVPLNIFLLIALINAYNLIDGIDGMASIIGIIVATSFALIFFYLGLYYYVAICVSLISILGAFLRYNLSSKKKIFMGDTGSLLIGLVLGILSLKLLSFGQETYASIGMGREDIPLFLLSVLIIPAFDVARVIFIRLKHKKPFFHPDRNHIHHILIDSGLSHKKASMIAGLINIVIIGVMYFSITNFGTLLSTYVLLVLLLCLVYVFFVLDKKSTSKRTKVKIRNLLFKMYNFFTLRNKKSSDKKLAFNQKLKTIRFLFF